MEGVFITKKKRMLMICTRLHLPATKGDSLVIINRIRYLSKFFDIDLLTYSNDRSNLEPLQPLCEIYSIPFSIPESFISIIAGNPLLPLQVKMYAQKSFKHKISKLLDNNQYDYFYLFLSRSGFALNYLDRKRTIYDFIDSLGWNFEQLAKGSRFSIRRILYQIESVLLDRYERLIAHSVPISLVVSEADRLRIGGENMEIIPNGVSIGESEEGVEGDKFKIFTFVFSGNLKYLPNIKACERFCDLASSFSRRADQKIQYLIAGIGAPDNLVKKMEQSGVTYLGYVERLPEILSRSSCALIPITLGSGIQNKVLESMAVGIPVILTTKAAGSIGLKTEVNCIIADDDESILDSMMKLVNDSILCARIGKSGRKFVEKRHSWSKNQKLIIDLINRLGV